MIDYQPFIDSITPSRLRRWAELLPEQIAQGLSTQRYGDLPDWLAAMDAMPKVSPSVFEIGDSIRLGSKDDITDEQREQLVTALKALIPWRKGPYHFFDTFIDTEWRSDWKWDRLIPHISDLTGKQVLDVGCGNGYHCWRMHDAGAARVIGIDPSPRFVVQFHMLKQYLDAGTPVDLLPVGIEALPEKLEAFDTTFSMGVLYHRRSPMDHLRELKDTLKPGGELVLETLIVDGPNGTVLVPEGRYAMMNNVWFLPSADTLVSWLTKCGFKNSRCVDINTTSLQEQRVTDWMQFQSLENFLDPEDMSLTAEGHPAPKRGIFIATKP
ncbi:tRNA 5-methoxyuridine(34)/uridine 5-oxyacetic acid(34) synthase CmoB [Teredinibacter sp. KSP-S5-2]|uniref:tRNA 5-methoxyuridine(34)/uridine 5-oxyacetic acid(34) synthase CmoB n=1 Tax=Teredinibacter sp. KSP-S5-2 TaxID=3034506 RepID=UPI0029345045|nr:tRNA 5-methoxyuridine(34)/uridine 5-oxyacetic acid(34) synthase CmoB [Teredinibacter sp. KSP-S5-2]WNO07724.1 tRNA 5-methoxyuridine(34)/uridine 5-oxyacetic acid(34) synthase CmoB [Teredinibacter sp. KSP-S5-2]